ncbi:MAG TPA: GNAT family N-acetyltransferase [bacterium]|nr:MAG: putative N-acetyltransferase YjcF [bacterium ADurb.Bin270]HPW46044.1 GNAT family N-acetyltransferase [bacterium]HQC50709.1 GNAT family N-acetyltransferase [bacterium]
MEIRFINTQDPLYRLERALRVDVLRKPLGLDAGTEEFPFERESLHLIALDGKIPVGCVLFRPQGKTGRLYQMAVREKYRGQGLGAMLVREMEKRLISDGIEEVYLHARHTSAPFFEKLGYKIEGEPFIEIGIEHRMMKKNFRKIS